MGIKSYVVYSNKGGTGKTTLAFQLSAEYALRNKQEQVVVIDMCPQANISQVLLAKSDKFPLKTQPGKVNVSKKSLMLIELSSERKYEQTVGGYILAMLDTKNAGKRTFNCQQFLVNVHEFNQDIPENVHLLCGDRHLDVLSKRLEQERQLTPTRYNENPWKTITLFIKDFIDSLSHDCIWQYSCFVIDTNSNNSIYTEMAISAAKWLIVPFTADDFSLSAIESMLYSVYGYESDEDKDERFENFKESQYFWLAQTNTIERAKLFLFVFNRVTCYGSEDAHAFDAIRDRLVHILKQVVKYDSGSRSSRKMFCFPPHFSDDESIKERYIVDVHDFHSTGIVSLHSGCPMSKVKNGDHFVYDFTCKVHISRDQKIKYNKGIGNILQKMYDVC